MNYYHWSSKGTVPFVRYGYARFLLAKPSSLDPWMQTSRTKQRKFTAWVKLAIRSEVLLRIIFVNIDDFIIFNEVIPQLDNEDEDPIRLLKYFYKTLFSILGKGFY